MYPKVWFYIKKNKQHTYCACHPCLHGFCVSEPRVCTSQHWVKEEWRWKGYCHPLPWQPASPPPHTAPPPAPIDSSSTPLPRCRNRMPLLHMCRYCAHYVQISPRSHMIMWALLTPGDDIRYSHRPLQLLILYWVIEHLNQDRDIWDC